MQGQPRPSRLSTIARPHRHLRRRWATILLGLLLPFAAFGPRVARAQLSATAQANFHRQLDALHAEHEARTSTQKKIHTQLWRAAEQVRTGVASRAVSSLRANIDTEADGRVKVRLTAAVTPELLGFHQGLRAVP